MEYLVLIYRNEARDGEADWPALGVAYQEYTDAAGQAGVLRGGKRLQPTATATTVAVRGGERVVTDGPFAETREQRGGFYVVECQDVDEAVEWGARCPGASHGTVEVRPVAAT